VRWLVDGMNVIGSRPDGWWKDRQGAMVWLVGMLESFARVTGDEVTVVFEQPPSPPIESAIVVVAHAPRAERNAADDEIVRRLEADRRPEQFTVVTSDHELARRSRGAGAAVEPANAFRNRLENGEANPQ
jgi:predicted RNA-binding protein with PIN domain